MRVGPAAGGPAPRTGSTALPAKMPVNSIATPSCAVRRSPRAARVCPAIASLLTMCSGPFSGHERPAGRVPAEPVDAEERRAVIGVVVVDEHVAVAVDDHRLAPRTVDGPVAGQELGA